MKKLTTFICIAMTCLSATGQTLLDSLKTELTASSTQDTLRVSLLLKIADALVWNDPDEALDYAHQARELANTLDWQKGIARALRQEGIVHYEQSDPVRAMDFFQKALKTAEPLHDRRFNASIYNNIANIYSDLKQYDKALAHYQHLLSIAKELNDTTNQVIAMVNMASIYIEQQHMAEGISRLTQALSMTKRIGNQRFEMAIHNNLGRALAKQGNDEKALQHFNACLALAEQLGSTGVKANVLNSVGELLINQHRYAEAERHSKEALALAENVGALEWQANAWQTLSRTYEELGKATEALHAYQSFIQLRDSAVNEEKKAEITRKEMQFTLEKQEAIAAAELDRQRMLMYATVGIVLILLAAVILGWRFYKRRRDSDERKRIAEFEALVADTEMKALRAQMNPHFIFNSLTAIGNSIAEKDFTIAGDYLRQFAKLIRLILENSEYKAIPLATDLQTLELYMQLEARRLKGKFTYEIDMGSGIDPENTLVPPLILQPLVENSIWHGLIPKDGHGQIWIKIRQEGESLCYMVEDNGVGRAIKSGSTTTAKQSMGIALTRARVAITGKEQQSEGNISFHDLPNGLSVSVRLPLALQF
ncbi:hypothetical protein GCM10007415_15010 [Parapedobacter pyrenivorans]|uniref:Signal transduction histidine kinase internal region domain-containing protein n=1 Tax=Parapedobacter pyrenivorans TaxID=1305674 RepID=A0A917M945_9SPHI|nr:tetratricopeptide repeat protein [Parapedobacter pyrenivorans]GGG83051.1 hypothetical protein GCM10007415_15010 [Parapedobacter pyrenivorans]